MGSIAGMLLKATNRSTGSKTSVPLYPPQIPVSHSVQEGRLLVYVALKLVQKG